MTMVSSLTVSLLLLVVCSTTVTSFVAPLAQVQSCRSREVACQQHPGSTGPYFEDFERLYHDQTAEYGIDLARQFQREQQVRIRRRQRRRNQLQLQAQQVDETEATEPEVSTPSNSPGYFSTPGVSPRIALVPTTAARRRMMQSSNNQNQNPWTRATSTQQQPRSATNEDNLFLIMMSATVAAVAPSTTPVLVSVVAFLLSLSLSMFFILGDESPLATRTTTHGTFMFPSPTTSTVMEHSQSSLFSQIHGL
eukprot:CAMPEP_0170383054 /NCGR_PEP_ID=MMETSP0117_2-20130122/15274_1 /TAXON_ID=400756 /ORGANISM="Durinskia baltica, Strain CSIRO CS-38" /LENGTH=250 /DNA_ID=CAMNT_0010638739 /DNA_START=51 /DNA_END=803 /DNA_ORIENTATION=-